LRLRRVALREIRLPLREPFRISSGVSAERRILLVELEDTDGYAVPAECVAGELPNYSPDTIDTCWLALREWFVPRLLRAELHDAAETDALLSADIRGHRMARAALEMGIWALFAIRDGVSLASKVGGVQRRVPVGISLGIQDSPAALVKRASAAAEQGYRKIKLKIEPGRDIEYVRAVRNELGGGAHLMVDANNAYTLEDAPRLATLDEFDLMMIEQPLDHEDLVAHAALQKWLRTPLCLDESITSPARALDMITLGSGRIVNIKPGRVGGFTASRAIHDVCAQADVPVWCGGMLESGIGRAYNVALASLPNFRLPGDLSPSARYWERDIVEPAWTMDADGMVTVPFDRPGLGIAVDTDRVDALTVRLETSHT
jgi:o-succinylbenzoate synthase